MAYKIPKYHRSTLTSQERLAGETIEQKVERIVSNKEPITDGAPEIYTERKDGIGAAYNIRTDRFEIAAEAMDKVQASLTAKRDNKAKAPNKEEAKIIKLDGEAESNKNSKEA
jgi:hypothetical protein